MRKSVFKLGNKLMQLIIKLVEKVSKPPTTSFKGQKAY